MRHLKAELFKVLAHPTRIRILDALRSGALTVTELQQTLSLEQPNVSQHLSALRGRGVVETLREGNSVRYSVADVTIWELLDTARDICDRQLHTSRAIFEASR